MPLMWIVSVITTALYTDTIDGYLLLWIDHRAKIDRPSKINHVFSKCQPSQSKKVGEQQV